MVISSKLRRTSPATTAIFYTRSKWELIGRLWRFVVNLAKEPVNCRFILRRLSVVEQGCFRVPYLQQPAKKPLVNISGILYICIDMPVT